MKKYKAITLSPDIIEKIDKITKNRSRLINEVLKDYFKKQGENVEKIIL